jgi:hypothetical protein
VNEIDTPEDRETVDQIRKYLAETKRDEKDNEPATEPLVCDQVSQDSHGRGNGQRDDQ